MTDGGSTSWISRLGAIGDRPTDDDRERLKHRLLVFMGVLMSGGGLLWGSIAASQDLFLPAVIPYGYTVLTFFNLSYFRLSKNFVVVRFFQVLISLLLPFLFQWSLGGFSPSGAVMLWAMLALVGSLTFSESRSSLNWLIVYAVLTIGSGIVDSTVREQFSPDPSEAVRTTFFVINIVIISSIVFGLMIYLLAERERVTGALAQANARITELNEHLEDEVAARTAELGSALARSRAIVDNLPNGLVAIDHEGRIQAWNPAFATLLSRSEDLTARAAADVLPSALSELATRAIDERQVERTELPLPGDRIGAAVASPICTEKNGAKDCVGAVVILRDVTLEKEIDRMKTDFIATVSHELRTPLTSVLGFAKLTKSKLEATVFPHVPADDTKSQRAVKQVSGNMDIIVSEGQRLTSLINDVLDISKMEAGRMEWKLAPVDPASLITRAVDATSALFTSDAVKLVHEIEPSLPAIEADADRMLQVMINLVSNAAKFTDAGSVTVRARRHPDGLELSVTDTGAGIEVADQESIFEKFKQVGDTLTSKPKGTGLGLPICKQIVSAHRGTIQVESRPGAGATFRVVLPVEGSAQATSSTTSSQELTALVERIETTVDHALPDASGDVLVVDDDASLRELLRQQLGERGYTVRVAANGTEAIQSVRQRRPDVIVLDVMMPDISGFDVAAVLKSDPKTQSIPIVILSIVQDADRGYRLGVDRYLTKPAEAEVLVSEVQRIVRRSRSARRVLFVGNATSATPELVKRLEDKGYELVGSCRTDAALEQARRTAPDVIIVDANGNDDLDIVRAIRLDESLAQVYVVQLMDEVRP
jgi:signal transduction histidine kinase/CheY-like chemotaxis protein